MSRSSSNSQTRRNLPPASARIRIANDNHIQREHDREGPIPSSLSLLSARRPSWAPPLYDHSQESISSGLASYRDVPTHGFVAQASKRSQPSTSPDDGGNFRRSLQIDMKDLVGDAVGSMSISPASRDIVLAARRGLFIIDLEAPLEIPRFLPQGGTWDVADVQWNPHRARAEYIVSTSSEKLLIWNLMLIGKTSIEHILHSHYRAITDINWHTSEPETVCSVGIDSWLWSWDLREPRKPVMAGGTQVKWNRQDPNVLASSHMDEVLIWDRRKGSLPTARIRAHNAKIYGIDWAHARAHDIVTCSLDKTIKVWNVQDASASEPPRCQSYSKTIAKQQPQPLTTIMTRYPVWRARDLPFGRGILIQSHGQNQNQRPVPIPGTTMTMSRGHAAGGKSARMGMDAFTWLASVRVGEKREGSSGRDSGVSSGSRSRTSADGGVMPGQGQKRKRSESRLREGKEGEGAQSLPDEITSVLTKLATSKIRLEKHELTKKRACTLGLHGPWGESSSVFIRVFFRFPKGYPHAPHPEGTPEIELERSPLISMQNRAFMLRRLRTIRERRRPCLEACLRFLLFGDENEQVGIPVDMRSESSSEDEGPTTRKSRDFTVSLLRNNKNLAEPRTSQGVFGPNGELVCFFRAPPRIVRHHQVGSSSEALDSTATTSRSPQSSSRFFQSPALLSDAVRRLGLAAADQRSDIIDSKRPGDSENTLRIMTNLLTFSQQRVQRDSGLGPGENTGTNNHNSNVAMIPIRRSTVLIKVPTDISFARRKVAEAYIFQAATLAELCEVNARIAREHGQFAHQRVFRTLQSLFPAHFCASHDVQMLAMISVLLLKAYVLSVEQRNVVQRRTVAATQTPSTKEPSPTVSKNEGDYFSLLRPKDSRVAVLSPGWPRLPSTSPTASNYPAGSSLSTSNSSRGSWSSLFNTGSVRQFMSGVQESITTPLDTLPARLSVPIPGAENMLRFPNPDSPRRKGGRDQSSTTSPISKSWSETQAMPSNRPSPFSVASHGRRPTFSQVISPKQVIQEKNLILIEEEPERLEAARCVFRPNLEPGQLAQFACHILAYADVLFSWQLPKKRLELLTAVRTSSFIRTPPQNMDMGFDIQPACGRCGREQSSDDESCSMCGSRWTKPSCSICRLPVKGLARSCGQCMHITHLKCWRDNKSDTCGTGCGCRCSGLGPHPGHTSFILSPVSVPSLL
ncbi:hypothetical protein PAXINDRAFT_162821 [Paxillus involutus ATCC 200175]|uniref:WDR59/RTC1-like RING zinc finger domain-containing protein n=1 Tax=Paxillus involutus ATCC 200175 TaxID=664439 RepID=A0A0C9TZD1_PAXIN|nr:hypothetical protein PAXINDRAFT_162821 [Paxillus involutus ATCC 200175]